jgi:hypothetical protein
MAALLRQTLAKLGSARALRSSPMCGVRLCSEDYRPDYYSALGVSKAADVKQIKLAYFRMAKKYHPVSAGLNVMITIFGHFHLLST